MSVTGWRNGATPARLHFITAIPFGIVGNCELGSAPAFRSGHLGHLDNQLLARLDSATFASLEKDLAVISLSQGDIINQTRDTVRKVYFPHSGIISCVVELLNGRAIETGMIGNDGQFGAGPALDHKVSLNLVMMQIAGTVSVMDVERMRDLAQQHSAFREQLMSYEQFFLAQVQQTAACNAVHNVQARACKWLLRMQKLVGNDLRLTQEFLAQMMGVRRTSVTEVAGLLQREGMITYSAVGLKSSIFRRSRRRPANATGRSTTTTNASSSIRPGTSVGF